MKGGKGLDCFRKEMIEDTRIKIIYDYENANECFYRVHIDGGICYFIWDSKYNGKVSYYYKPKDENRNYSKRYLKTDYCDTVIRDYRQASIIEKTSYGLKFNSIVSARNPYSIESELFYSLEKYEDLNTINEDSNKFKIYGVYGKKGGAKRVVAFIPKHKLKNNQIIDDYKLFFSKAYMTTSTIPPEIIIGKPNEISTETFLKIGSFKDDTEADNCLKYVKSKFFRALLFYNRHSLNISKESFNLIPLQDFTSNSDINWSKSTTKLDKEANEKYECSTINEIDAMLYKKYGLEKEEVQFIEKTIKPMK